MEENRIRELRKARHMSGEDLAKAAGTSVQQIYRLETGARKLTIDWVRKIAKALGCNEYEILGAMAAPQESCSIVGFVTDQETVRPYHRQKRAPRIPPGDANVAALEILTVSLRPRYDEGDLLYFERPASNETLRACIGQECVLELEDGGMILRTVMDVIAENLVRTCVFGSYKVEEMVIKWAAPVQWVLRTDNTEKK